MLETRQKLLKSRGARESTGMSREQPTLVGVRKNRPENRVTRMQFGGHGYILAEPFALSTQLAKITDICVSPYLC